MTAGEEPVGLPTTSVVVIFQDEERFLPEAVRSVFEQTSEDWELLLVDDGSVDASTAQARALARDHPGRVRYLDHPGHARRGTGATRQLGLHAARGRCVAFLDADDVWQPGKLAEQVQLLDEHGVALVYGRVQEWHSWDPESQQPDGAFELGVPDDTRVASLEAFSRILENRYQTPTTSGSLLSRAAALAVGGFDDGFPGMYEDQAFFAKLVLTTDVWVSGRCWARYRQHPGSTSARDRVPYRAGRLVFLRWVRRYVASIPAARTALPLVDAEVSRVRRMPTPVEERLRAVARRGLRAVRRYGG